MKTLTSHLSRSNDSPLLYSLYEEIELHEESSVDLRKLILKKHQTIYDQNFFNMIIFPGKITIKMHVSYPNCILKSFDKNRLTQLLNISENTPPGEDIADKIMNFSNLALLTDLQIAEIKKIFQVHLLEDITKLNIFYEFGTFCEKKHMSENFREKIYTIDKIPNISSHYFCWLQILPLVKSYPSIFLKNTPNSNEYEIKALKVYTQEYAIISEALSNSEPLCLKDRDFEKLYVLPMPLKPLDDIYSHLYQNRTIYDVMCLYHQCELMLTKLGKDKEFQSYRLRFLSFIINDQHARIPYLSLKIYKEIQNGKSFLWYR